MNGNGSQKEPIDLMFKCTKYAKNGPKCDDFKALPIIRDLSYVVFITAERTSVLVTDNSLNSYDFGQILMTGWKALKLLVLIKPLQWTVTGYQNPSNLFSLELRLKRNTVYVSSSYNLLLILMTFLTILNIKSISIRLNCFVPKETNVICVVPQGILSKLNEWNETSAKHIGSSLMSLTSLL